MTSQKEIGLLEKGVEHLLHNTLPSNSLYLLGSGVSARHSKMEHQLVGQVVSDYYDGGFFEVDDKANDSLALNLIWRYMAYHEDDFLKDLSRKIPDNFIKTRINEEYAQLTPLHENPEYQVFLLARRGSTIIDMNYEGFSSQYLKHYHHIIDMHGTANPLLAKFTQEIKEDILVWGVDLSNYSNIKIYPGQKQTYEIIKPYIQFLTDHTFPNIQWIAIIGYSFANTGNKLNDEPFYELIIEHLAYFKNIRIMIINPNPEPVAVLFEKFMDRVIIVPAYWNALTRSIKINQFILRKNSLQKIIYDYYRSIEK